MCTVTYVPGSNGFFLTSNRDESSRRSTALPPKVYSDAEFSLLYPKDADKNGSWIVGKSNGNVIVLLNGAFEKHDATPPYFKSRGLILIEIIRSAFPDQFFRTMNLDGIEPFTCILHTGSQFVESRWDGLTKHIRVLDERNTYIWSSATLYNKDSRRLREEWFNDWCGRGNPITTEEILSFHKSGGDGNQNHSLIIDRAGKIGTVSITSLFRSSDKLSMTHLDLRSGNETVDEMPILPHVRHHFQRPTKLKLAIRTALIRLFHWEFWSFNALYGPIIFYWFWLSLKARSFFFFSTANPLIENSGFTMESKAAIYPLIPKQYVPKTLRFSSDTNWAELAAVLAGERLSYPLIAKPDIGGRGIRVKLVHSASELQEYASETPVDYLVQELIPYKNEVGIFYCRLPGEKHGRITGIVGKEFLQIKGDGRSTIGDLLLAEPRFVLQYRVLEKMLGSKLDDVLPDGENRTLVPYGNHARGAKFIDLSHLITEKFNISFDAFCRQIPDFYFGRLDVMYDNWDDLESGKKFQIVELNGAGSEPTHIYDPSHSLLFGWSEIIRHWKILYEIAAKNHKQRGIPYLTFREGWTMLKKNSEYFKIVS
ncbi:NRDE family protein [Mucilaginibacter sp.]|jgi:hypothetical protein|uniref:NRDE family protein n=1 Tax=Mucilaginibacter sp. TaxID=1882438 RepID=UPI00356226B5